MVRLPALIVRALAVLVLSAGLAHADPAPEKDYLLSDPILAQALDAIIAKARIDRDHDIPYVAGYSQNGKIIYIDRSLPKGYDHQGHFVETDRFLILHEAVEKAMIDLFDLRYQQAHQIALRAERAAVAAAKIEWADYDGFMQQHIDKIGEKALSKVPADLDLRPYRDENDAEVLARMRAGLEKADVKR